VGQADAIVVSPPWQDSIGNAAGCPDVKTVRPHLPPAVEVAAYLKACRLSRGLTRREVDRYLGTNTLYSWYEGRPAGFEIPTPEHWRELKPLLGLDDRFDHGILTEAVVDATGRLTTDKTGHAVMGDYGTAPGQVGALKPGPCPGGEADVGDVETLEWAGIYSQGWGRGLLSPGAFSHPAKFAYGLLTRLYDHGFARGWWQKGSIVVDPFGGVGCGGVVAAYRGLRWIGCELEPRFISLAEETFALHRGKWAAAGDIPPVIVQGDSRRFAALVAGAAGLVTSPPYADAQGSPSLGSVNKDSWGSDGRSITARRGLSGDYGDTPGQLGALPQGDADSVLASPPYTASVHGRNGINLAKCDRPGAHTQAEAQGYGATPGQLGALKAGDADSVVTSPPYEGSTGSPRVAGADIRKNFGSGAIAERGAGRDTCRYGDRDGQVGHTEGETYWSAMKIIWEQAFLALRPSGVLCCVIKDFVRSKKRVPLCDQTWRLLLSLGFTPVERIRCLLSEETREPSLFGGVEVKKRSRVSFFRRLAEKKGSPVIDAEEILVVRRPPPACRD
jgi:hypothetical protein